MKKEDLVKDVKDKIKFMDKKTKTYIIVCAAIVVLIILIAIVACALKDKMYDYIEVEDKMVDAAKSYYKTNESLLPTDGVEDLLQMNTLVEGKYIKSFDRMLKDGANCSGEVKVRNTGGTITYIPYLNCGSAYFSLELYKKITDEANIVTSGDGLYKVDDSYIFRGQNVNNYVTFADKIWLVVKVTPENETILIENKIDTKISYFWDNRYNVELRNNSGINEFNVSRLKDSMTDIYGTYFSDELKLKLALMDLCTGNRKEDEALSLGKLECTTMLRDQYIGVLDAYDFMYASLDKTCSTPKDLQCQNYNYLANANRSWWLMTGDGTTTNKAYMIRTTGAITPTQCNTKSGLRPVISLKNEVFLRGGSGTEEDPYVIK